MYQPTKIPIPLPLNLPLSKEPAMKAFEVHNPDFSDMNLMEQIEAGCNDWCVEGHSGHRYYGHSARAAMQDAALYFFR
jgi:hypothetical protein